MVAVMIEATVRGPVFDGRADAEADAFMVAAVREVAREGERLVGLELIRVLRNPSGYYESHIRTDEIGYARRRVNDDNVIYGPWLEGTGSRNKTTRFRGYSTFRRMGQQLDREAAGIAETILPPYLARMRGE